MFSRVNFDMGSALADKENVGISYQPVPMQKTLRQVTTPARTPLANVQNFNTPHTLGRLSQRQMYTPVGPLSSKKHRSRSLGRPHTTSTSGGMLNALLHKQTLKVVQSATKDLKNKLSERDEYIRSLESRLLETPKESATSPMSTSLSNNSLCEASTPESTENMKPDIKLHSILPFTPLHSNCETDLSLMLATPTDLVSELPIQREEDQDVPALILESEEEEDMENIAITSNASKDDITTDKLEESEVRKPQEDNFNKLPVPENNNNQPQLQTISQAHPMKVRHPSPSEICNALAVNLEKLSVEKASDNIEGNLLAAAADAQDNGFTSPHNVSHSCSPHPTPRPLKSYTEDKAPRKLMYTPDSPDVSLHEKENQGGKKCVDVGCSPINMSNFPFDLCQDENQENITCRNLSESLEALCGDSEENFTEDCSDVESDGWDSEDEENTKDSAVGPMTPVQDSVVEMQTLAFMCDANCGTTPQQMVSSQTETDRVESQTVSTCYTPVQLKSSACGRDDELVMKSKCIGSTPLQQRDSGSMVTPVRLISTASCSSPTVLSDMACNTTTLPTSEASVCTSDDPVTQQEEMGTMVSPVKLCHTGAGSSDTFRTDESATTMTPVKLNETSTSMTPLQYRQTNIYTMLESLHCEYTRSQDYQPRYQEAMQRMAEMEAQLQCYTHLTPLLKQANAAQAEANENLQKSFDQVKVMSAENMAEREKLDSERAVFEKERDENDGMVQAAMEEYASMKEEYISFQDRLTSAEDRAQQVESEMGELRQALETALKKKTELQTQNETINKELSSKKDHLSALISGLKEAKHKNESLQQAYINLQRSYQKLDSNSKENIEFMESEQSALRDELMETSQTLNTKLTDTQQQLQQARRLVNELEEELDATRNTAHLHALSLNAEITDSIISTASLAEKLDFLRGQLQSTAASWGVLQQEEPVAEPPQQQPAGPMSFLASILSAVHETEHASEHAASEAAQACSAFTAVVRKPSPPPPAPVAEQTTSSEDTTGRNTVEEEEDEEDSSEELALNEEITELTAVVEDIWKLMASIQQAVLNNNRTLKQTIEELQEGAEESADKAARQLREEQAKSQAADKRMQELHRTDTTLRSEMSLMREDLHKRDKELAYSHQMLLQRADRIHELADQSSHMKRVDAEVKKLHQQVREKECECMVLREAMEDALSKSGSREHDIRTKQLLNKELNNLRMQLLQTKEQAQDMAAKANSRTRTYEENLKKAEREISVLDHMVDKIRQVILRHKEQTVGWPEMRRLWPELIGGDYPYATPNTPRQPSSTASSSSASSSSATRKSSQHLHSAII